MNKIYNKIKYIFERIVLLVYINKKNISDVLTYIEAYKIKLEEDLNNESCKEITKQQLKYFDSITVNAVNKLVKKYCDNNDFNNAIKGCKYIYNNYPNDTENLKNYRNCICSINPLDLVLINKEELLKTEDKAKKRKILSETYSVTGNYKKAINLYNRFLELSGQKELNIFDCCFLGICYSNLCNSMPSAEYRKQALSYFKQALSIEPENINIIQILLHFASVLKDWEVEKECFDKSVELGYKIETDDFFSVYYSNYCLNTGNIEGWKKSYKMKSRYIEDYILNNISKPEWKGEDISSSTLLILSEDGFGDDFLMWGYISRLKKLAKKIIYYMNDATYELFKYNDCGVLVYSKKDTDIKQLTYDYYISCSRIPKTLNLSINNISVIGGYIKAEERLVKKYKEKYFDTDKLKIGLAFRGNPLYTHEHKKNIPLDKLCLLDSLDNIQFYCFTKDIKDEELQGFKRNNIINLAKSFSSFADTAAAIENTDIMVSGDNCVLNLAGAMGKRTLGMFSCFHPIDRWYDLTGDDCGWYKSVKPIVNDENDNWEISLRKAISEINNIMSEKKL
ncbi:MAG: hypothetical protein LUH05_01580 [Candidatus Gastranaerophilales bacterium]|nr:hypothetical protein [Candidatus Gastranaerophilales bacterium]